MATNDPFSYKTKRIHSNLIIKIYKNREKMQSLRLKTQKLDAKSFVVVYLNFLTAKNSSPNLPSFIVRKKNSRVKFYQFSWIRSIQNLYFISKHRHHLSHLPPPHHQLILEPLWYLENSNIYFSVHSMMRQVINFDF